MGRAGVGAVALGVMLLTACDRSSEASDTTTLALPPSVPQRSTVPQTVASTTTTSPATTSPSPAASVQASLGPLRFEVPTDAVIDPRPRSAPPPAFVAASERWIVPETVSLTVTLETIVAPMPPAERVAEFEANGLTWQVFDSGPRNGSLIVAMATIDTGSVLVSAQSWTFDPTDVPRRYAEDLARSVTHHAT